MQKTNPNIEIPKFFPRFRPRTTDIHRTRRKLEPQPSPRLPILRYIAINSAGARSRNLQSDPHKTGQGLRQSRKVPPENPPRQAGKFAIGGRRLSQRAAPDFRRFRVHLQNGARGFREVALVEETALETRRGIVLNN